MAYLTLQAAGGLVWWSALFMWPASRPFFSTPSNSDAMLMAFLLPDVALYVGLSAGCAYGLGQKKEWAWTILCVHAGAALYAALYAWNLCFITAGQLWLGAVLMTPSLVVPGMFAWLLRSREPLRC